jgi:hypothetical protein
MAEGGSIDVRSTGKLAEPEQPDATQQTISGLCAGASGVSPRSRFAHNKAVEMPIPPKPAADAVTYPSKAA